MSLSGLWKLLKERQPPINCTIDEWTKPHIWKHLALSKHLEYYAVDFNGPKLDEIPRKSVRKSSICNKHTAVGLALAQKGVSCI